MPVREFELFHGAVLAKLVRNDRPVTLRMIETDKNVAWASYKINDAVTILVKYRSESYRHTRSAGAASWQFVFSPEEVTQIDEGRVWAALVCGGNRLGQEMEVCLLDPDQLAQVVPSSGTPSLTVRSVPGRMLRVSSSQCEDEILVPRRRIERWNIPGS